MVVAGLRCPSAGWLQELSGRVVVSGGLWSGGSRLFVQAAEEAVCAVLTAPLLQLLTQPLPNATHPPHSHGHLTDDDATSMLSAGPERDLGRGLADCVLLAGGRALPCHRALLAHRSPELRSRIAAEAALNSPTPSHSQHTTQLLLPELQRDSARALLVFLYTDGLPDFAVGDVTLLGSLRRAASTFRMPRLALLCDSFLRLVASVHAADTNGMVNGIDGRDFLSLPWELPPATLAR